MHRAGAGKQHSGPLAPLRDARVWPRVELREQLRTPRRGMSSLAHQPVLCSLSISVFLSPSLALSLPTPVSPFLYLCVSVSLFSTSTSDCLSPLRLPTTLLCLSRGVSPSPDLRLPASRQHEVKLHNIEAKELEAVWQVAQGTAAPRALPLPGPPAPSHLVFWATCRSELPGLWGPSPTEARSVGCRWAPTQEHRIRIRISCA